MFLGLEKPSIASLLQAAYLSWQQIIRGIPYKVAIVNSFSDVYIKPRCGGDFTSTINMGLSEMKNNMWNSLQKLVCDHQLNDAISTNHTLSVAGLCKHSSFEIVKQISYPLLQQLTVKDINYAVHCLFNLCIAYDKSSSEYRQILYNILNHELQIKHSDSKHSFVKKLNDIAVKIASTKGDTYKRYFRETYNLNNDEIYSSNADFLSLYNELLKEFECTQIQQLNFSALEYSKAVLSGKITDDFVQYPILKYCQTYVQLVNECIDKILNNNEIVINDETTCKIIQLLNWRSRFINICSKAIFVTMKNKRTPILKEEVVPLMYMHSKWLEKHLIEELFKLLQSNDKIAVEFKNTMKTISMNANKNSTLFNKINKKIRKLYGQPKLYANDNQYEVCVRTAELYSKIRIDLNQPLIKQKQKLLIEDTYLTNYNLGLDVPENDRLDYFQEVVTKTFALKSENINLGSEMKLLPVKNYIILRVINLLQNYFLKTINKLQFVITTERQDAFYTLPNDFEVNSVRLLNYLIDCVKSAKGFPLEFVNLLDLLRKLQDDIQDQNISER